MLLNQATVEALTGEIDQARNTVSAATKLARSKDEKSQAAFVVALAGEELKARQIIDELALEYPSDTLLNAIDVPLVHAALQLRRGHADQALRTLEPVKPYELGFHACSQCTFAQRHIYNYEASKRPLLNSKPCWTIAALGRWHPGGNCRNSVWPGPTRCRGT